MTDFAKAFIQMLRTDPHVITAFGHPAPIFADMQIGGDPYVSCQVKPETDDCFDISLTVWTWSETRTDIRVRLDALAEAIRTGRIEGFEAGTRRIRLTDIFLDDSGKTRSGLLRARVVITTHKNKEKQYYEQFS